MAIARLDVGIRSLATAHALHPIQHVCAGCLVDSSVAAGFDPGSAFHQIARLQAIHLHAHRLCSAFVEPAVSANHVLI